MSMCTPMCTCCVHVCAPRADVVTFEPVAHFRAVIAAGLTRNPPPLAKRVSVLPNIVYDQPGVYTLRVPVPVPGSLFKRLLGMSSMVDGAYGLVKGVIDVRNRHGPLAAGH